MLTTMPVRPKKDRLELRIDAVDLERWRACADKSDMTLSNWVREWCNAIASMPMGSQPQGSRSIATPTATSKSKKGGRS